MEAIYTKEQVDAAVKRSLSQLRDTSADTLQNLGAAALGEDGTLPVAQGGTGAKNAQGARQNLQALSITAPQIINLQPAAGFEIVPKTPAYFQKMENGLVILNLYIKKSGPEPIGRGLVVVGHLPAGYRPPYNLHTSVQVAQTQELTYSNNTALGFIIARDGNVGFNNVLDNAFGITGLFSFFAN